MSEAVISLESFETKSDFVAALYGLLERADVVHVMHFDKLVFSLKKATP